MSDRLTTRRRMCASCPWRKGARPEAMPGGFDVEHAASLQGSCEGSDAFGEALLTCHCDDDNRLCAGWLQQQQRDGVPHLGLRFAIIAGRVRAPLPEPQRDHVGGFAEMLAQQVEYANE